MANYRRIVTGEVLALAMARTKQKSSNSSGEELLPENLRGSIRETGLRVTASRVAVLELVTRARTHLSHAEVVEALKSEVWDPATLYRNLMDLTEAGLMRRVDIGDRTWRFERARFQSPSEQQEHGHPHFCCTKCGDVTCLPSMSVEAGSPKIRLPESVRAGQFEVQLRGLCNTCT